MTTATKVEKNQTNSGVLIPSPPSSLVLLSNEDYNNPWLEFDSKSNTVSTQEHPWPQLSGCNTKDINFQEKTLLPSKQSSPDTTRKLSKINNSNMTQKKATCKSDYKVSMMTKDSKDCIKKKKQHKKFKKIQSQSNSVFTYSMSQTTPMNYVQHTDVVPETDKMKLQNTTSQTRNKSDTQYQSRQVLPYKRPKRKNAKDCNASLRPKIVSFLNKKLLYLFIFADS